jgi:hypothetical protein
MRAYLEDLWKSGKLFLSGFRRHLRYLIPNLFIVPAEIYEYIIRPYWGNETWMEHLIVPTLAFPWVMLGTFLWVAFLTYRDLYNERPILPVPTQPAASPIREFTIYTDPTTYHVCITFIPAEDIGHLVVRLDQARFEKGGITAPSSWVQPQSSVVANFQNLTARVPHSVALTSVGERNGNQYLKWENTQTPISQDGLYRCRVALRIQHGQEIRRYFLAVSSHHQNLGRPTIQIIEKSQFSFIEEWETEDQGRS